MQSGFGNTDSASPDALRSIGRDEMADQLITMMKQVGHSVQEDNPFEDEIRLEHFEPSPYASRLRLMWMKMRPKVISTVEASGIHPVQQSPESILDLMDAAYI